jgi:hypothetical protein
MKNAKPNECRTEAKDVVVMEFEAELETNIRPARSPMYLEIRPLRRPASPKLSKKKKPKKRRSE